MPLEDTPGSPDWWLLRLGRRLRDRREQKLRRWWRYWSGEPPLPQGPKGCTQAYLDFQKKARTNFCRTVGNAPVHRLQVIGITDAQGRSLDEAWGWWQRNRMDARQKMIYRAAMWAGEAYVMVGPHPADPGRPLITAEHPEQVIVERDPETGERAAALKSWYDDRARVGRATLLLPDLIVRYTTGQRSGAAALPWGTGSWELVSAENNPLGVAVVPFSNRPELGEDPVAEFDSVMDIQDRINLGMLNRMTAERYSAFRQKYVTGHAFAKRQVKEYDPVSGLEVVRAKVVEQPFRPDPGTVWASEGKDTRFGEFSQTDLMGYLKSHEADIRDLLVTTDTPVYYVATELVNLSADAVVALDANHNAKVAEHQGNFGESHEEVFELSAQVAGVDIDMSAAEVRWRDPRQFNPAVIADAGIKKKTIGYPLPMIAEDMGESPQRVARIRSESADAALLTGLMNPPVPAPAGLPPAGGPPALPGGAGGGAG